MSALEKRLYNKLNRSPCNFNLSQDDIRILKRAFVEALIEEVEARWGKEGYAAVPALYKRPLVIEGLGSFKMRTRPARQFDIPSGVGSVGTTTKPPARRLIFTAKWEPLP